MGDFLSPYPDWICQLTFPVRLKGLFHCHLVSDDANVHLMLVWLSFIRKLSVLSVRGLRVLSLCLCSETLWGFRWMKFWLFDRPFQSEGSYHQLLKFFLLLLLKWMWPFCVNPYCLLIKFFISILLYFLCFPWLLALVLLIFSPVKIFTSLNSWSQTAHFSWKPFRSPWSVMWTFFQLV